MYINVHMAMHSVFVCSINPNLNPKERTTYTINIFINEVLGLLLFDTNAVLEAYSAMSCQITI